MAPERRNLFHHPGNMEIVGQIDPRADIFSLGIVLKEMFQKARALPPGAIGTPEIETILNRCIEPDPDKRFDSAARLAEALEGCIELLGIAKRMPPIGHAMRFTIEHPLLGMTVFLLAPNLVGSIINIAYNKIRIVSHLTVAQQLLFRDLVILYNSILYPLCLAILIRRLGPLLACLKSGWLRNQSSENLDRLRKRVLGMPTFVGWITTLGWMPGCLLFPFGIQIARGPVSPAIFLHFFISFTLSWLISLTYSYLYSQFVALRLMYPRLWAGRNEIRRTAAVELATCRQSQRAFHFMAGFVPLTGAALLVLVGPDRLDASSYQTYRWLLALLIGLGMISLVSALKASNRFAETLFALTGTETNREDGEKNPRFSNKA